MQKIDFDNFAKSYDQIMEAQLKGFGEESAYFAEYKVRLVKERLQKTSSALPSTILEYGCGTGRNLPFFREYFPDAVIEGCDISAESLSIAARRAPDAALYLLPNNLPKKQYDLVFVACVFHHIPPAERAVVSAQIYDLMKPCGELFIFEHNPYNPITRHLVSTCPFDKDAILLTPAELATCISASHLRLVEKRYTLFYPAPLKRLRPTEAYLGWLLSADNTISVP
ncbi:MAG: class I SAM-dependent methyltransferase [Chloroherpetonaceae bacterium]|nr:class I SAM-dependent methyltransferase [Chloroherpetonaceae bacterium]